MAGVRFAAILVMVIVAAGATVGLAVAVANAGFAPWQAAIGPILLAALALVKWLEYRRKS